MILKKGQTSKQVAELQTLLKEKGYFTYPSITNYFGDITLDAVRRFQKDNGLVVNGIVDNRTWNALSNKKVVLNPISTGNNPAENYDADEFFDITKLPKVDGKYPTSSSALELVKFISQFPFKRTINLVVWHCTASHQTATPKAIIDYHLKTLKWSKAGYHIIIDPRGEWTYAVDFNIASNGVGYRNFDSLNIVYIGGIDKNVKPLDNRTDAQKATMELIYKTLKDRLPNAKHIGHYALANKACPSYNVENWIKEMEK